MKKKKISEACGWPPFVAAHCHSRWFPATLLLWPAFSQHNRTVINFLLHRNAERPPRPNTPVPSPFSSVHPAFLSACWLPRLLICEDQVCTDPQRGGGCGEWARGREGDGWEGGLATKRITNKAALGLTVTDAKPIRLAFSFLTKLTACFCVPFVSSREPWTTPPGVQRKEAPLFMDGLTQLWSCWC